MTDSRPYSVREASRRGGAAAASVRIDLRPAMMDDALAPTAGGGAFSPVARPFGGYQTSMRATEQHGATVPDREGQETGISAWCVDRDPLAERLATDRDGCFEELVVAYQTRLYSFALRMTGSPEDAEEIVQDAFVRAYGALGGYEAERVRDMALRPWLYRIALNVMRNRMRRKRPRLVALEEPDADGWEPVAGDGDRPEAIVARAEGEAELAGLVAALPLRYRTAVVFRHVAGLSYEEAAAALGQPVGTVKSNVHRGLRMLRTAIDERAGEAGR